MKAELVMVKGGHYYVQTSTGELLHEIVSFTIKFDMITYRTVWREIKPGEKLNERNDYLKDDHKSLVKFLRKIRDSGIEFTNYPGPLRMLTKI